MGNFQAIATVTATFQLALQAAIQADVPGATVSAVRPAESGSATPTTGVNIFLFQVSHNPHWGNADLPTRGADGEASRRPQAALDLHYLLSFYGDESTLEPQRLLGSTVAYLHSQPMLTRAQVAAAVSDPHKLFLVGSDLADQIDLVRFAPLSFTLDELSRLWSIFLQTHYVLSIAFKASVALIERNVTVKPAPPMRELRLAAAPLRHPFIQRILSQDGPDAAIFPGGGVVVEGTDLAGQATRVEVDRAPLAVATAEDTQIKLSLPINLAAGPHSLLVRQGVDVGASDGPRWTLSSNLAAFVAHPVITQTAGNFDIAITNVQGAGNAPRSATITVHVTPDLGTNQTATLELLNPQQVAYTFLAAPRSTAGGDLSFHVVGVTAGEYLFRVRVDGAESPLTLDAQRTPIAPKAAIP